MANEVTINISGKFKPYFMQPLLFNCLYGGRASGKSWASALFHIFQARLTKARILCVREIQKSIKDSSHKLLSDLISTYNLTDFQVLDSTIRNTVTGSEFIFTGLRDIDPEKIKSYEGITHCWVEEAQSISKRSLDVLIPTVIRNEGAIFTFTFNRHLVNDPVWQRFCVTKSDDTRVIKANYYDNPFINGKIKRNDQVLDEAKKSKEKDIRDYLHVWEGEPLPASDNQLLSSEDIFNARIPILNQNTMPIVIGVDVGIKVDKTVFAIRQGRNLLKLEEKRFERLPHVSGHIMGLIGEFNPSAVYIDAGGEGLGVVDDLLIKGYGATVVGINFGSSSSDQRRFKNMRAEMYYRIKEELTSGLPFSIPDDNELIEDLLAQELKSTPDNIIQLVPKDDIKKKLGRSPDKSDAFALTFAMPICYNSAIERQKVCRNSYKLFKR